MRAVLFSALAWLLATSPGATSPLLGNDAPDLTGVWKGVFHYPARAARRPVQFTAVLVDEAEEIRGLIVESNTFGRSGEPWLHAWVSQGRYDRRSQQVKFTKRYVGTAQVDHGVLYQGDLSEDATRLSGTWRIPGDWGSTFQLEKLPDTGSGRMSGVWSGFFRYDDPARADGPRGTAQFWMTIVRSKQGWWGYSEELNTFGEGDSPRLFASLDGRYDPATGEVSFTKTYDGTGRVKHAVLYRGKVGADGKLSGIWEIPDQNRGSFTAVGKPAAPGVSDGSLPIPAELPDLPELPSFEDLSR